MKIIIQKNEYNFKRNFMFNANQWQYLDNLIREIQSISYKEKYYGWIFRAIMCDQILELQVQDPHINILDQYHLF